MIGIPVRSRPGRTTFPRRGARGIPGGGWLDQSGLSAFPFARRIPHERNRSPGPTVMIETGWARTCLEIGRNQDCRNTVWSTRPAGIGSMNLPARSALWGQLRERARRGEGSLRQTRLFTSRKSTLLVLFAFVFVLGCLAVFESRTSTVQSRVLSHVAAKLTYKVEPGPSPSIAFPKAGPFDQRRGYTRLPEELARLKAAGYWTASQARISPTLKRLADHGIYPVYH